MNRVALFSLSGILWRRCHTAPSATHAYFSNHSRFIHCAFRTTRKPQLLQDHNPEDINWWDPDESTMTIFLMAYGLIVGRYKHWYQLSPSWQLRVAQYFFSGQLTVWEDSPRSNVLLNGHLSEGGLNSTWKVIRYVPLATGVRSKFWNQNDTFAMVRRVMGSSPAWPDLMIYWHRDSVWILLKSGFKYVVVSPTKTLL